MSTPVVTLSEILGGKILIVDDQEANVLVLERMLQNAGYLAVTSTRDPTEVHSLHIANEYDLILLDMQMPVMNGFQVMESLRETETGGYLPVLVLTAQPDHKLRALKAGARDFLSKPVDLAEVLARVHNMLEVRLLQAKTKRLYDEVLEHQQVSERLLLNVMPHFIAERLRGHADITADGFTEIIADGFPEATVLFADIVGFTRLTGFSPHQLVALLNEIFAEFDRIGENRGLEKIKTTGGVYMAVAGIPIPTADHAVRAAHMALDLIEAMKRFNARSVCQLEVRIGISSGAVVAGIIGTSRKFVYDLWGDAVSAAGQMESHGVAGQVHITEATKLLLDEPFQLEERGVIDLKSKAHMQTWFLAGRSADVLTL